MFWLFQLCKDVLYLSCPCLYCLILIYILHPGAAKECTAEALVFGLTALKAKDLIDLDLLNTWLFWVCSISSLVYYIFWCGHGKHKYMVQVQVLIGLHRLPYCSFLKETQYLIYDVIWCLHPHTMHHICDKPSCDTATASYHDSDKLDVYRKVHKIEN